MEKERNPEVEFAIEQLLSIEYIPRSAKSNIAQVFLGLKPACQFSILFEGKNTKGYTRENFNRDKTTLENALNILGLKYKFSEEETSEFSNDLQEVYVYVGQDDNKLENLYEAWRMKAGTKERDIKVGKALGIPESAIQSWVDGYIIKYSELPPDAAEDFQNAEFAPSRENWEEELIEVRRKKEAVKNIAPRLFEKP